MSARNSYFVQFYRLEPGDVGIKDVTLIAEQDVEEVARRALLGYFNNPNIAPVQRPHHARVISYDGYDVVLTLMATSATTAEKV